MEKLQITKGEAFTDGWHIMVDRKSQHTGIRYNRQIASVENAGTGKAESNAKLYVDAHNTYLHHPALPSELLRQNREMKEALERIIKNANDRYELATIRLGLIDAISENCLTSCNKGKE